MGVAEDQPRPVAADRGRELGDALVGQVRACRGRRRGRGGSSAAGPCSPKCRYSGLPQTLATRWPSRQPDHSSERMVQAVFHCTAGSSMQMVSGTPVEPDVRLTRSFVDVELGRDQRPLVPADVGLGQDREGFEVGERLHVVRVNARGRPGGAVVRARWRRRACSCACSAASCRARIDLGRVELRLAQVAEVFEVLAARSAGPSAGCIRCRLR